MESLADKDLELLSAAAETWSCDVRIAGDGGGYAWSHVDAGDHHAVAQHPDRTLLLVWPSIR
ncbi:hypothetical protein REH65_25395 [Saccharopolyspora sp. ID03-671]|uniref:hypothetical protein n=1 Tax=Saccharopolyspora sp. ID03-671 TaxID=3073066 RepID=UPI0032500A01